jgi:hypothetical protein
MNNIPIILPPIKRSKEGAPVSYIQEIVPINLGDDPFPSLVVLRWTGNGSYPTPIQVLSHKDGQYVDDTPATFIGSAGSTHAARSVAVANFNGRQGIVIADHGMDAPPFPGGQPGLLLQTDDGHLVNATSNLPQALGMSHDVTSGIIDNGGQQAIYISNLISQTGTPPALLLSDGTGHFTDISYRLPDSLSTFTPPFSAAALMDTTGNGLADLVLGTADAERGQSVVYHNPGNGDFSKVSPIILPSSPLAPVPSLFQSEQMGAAILDIKPIHISSPDFADLIVTSTNGNYTGYAVQLLMNDGRGNFSDQTANYFPEPIMGSGGWIKRVHVLKDDYGVNGLVTQVSPGSKDIHSQIFLLNNGNEFVFERTIEGGSAYGVMEIKDQGIRQETLIVSDGLNMHLEPVKGLYAGRRFGPINAAYVPAAQEIIDEFKTDFPEWSAKRRLIVIDGEMKTRKPSNSISANDRLVWLVKDAGGIELDSNIKRFGREGEDLRACKVELTAWGHAGTTLVIAPDADETLAQTFKRMTHFALPNVFSGISQEQHCRWTYDHELGHAVDEETPPPESKNKSSYLECVADAYATLRHRQRFGFESNLPAARSALRALAAVHVLDTYHDSADAIYLAERYARRQGNNFKNISPAQLLEKAQRIAKLVAFTDDQLGHYVRMTSVPTSEALMPFNNTPRKTKAELHKFVLPEIIATTPTDTAFVQGRRRRYERAIKLIPELSLSKLAEERKPVSVRDPEPSRPPEQFVFDESLPKPRYVPRL